MRRAIMIAGVVATGLVVAGVLGIATGQSPTPPTALVRSVSVQGLGTAPIDMSADATAAQNAYRAAQAAAIADGLAKAQFLAGKAGAGAGPVLSVVEDGGFVDCNGADYLGIEPDFGYASPASGFGIAGGTTAAPAPSAARPVARKHPPKGRKKKKAHAAVACTLHAQVALAYQLQ